MLATTVIFGVVCAPLCPCNSAVTSYLVLVILFCPHATGIHSSSESALRTPVDCFVLFCLLCFPFILLFCYLVSIKSCFFPVSLWQGLFFFLVLAQSTLALRLLYPYGLRLFDLFYFTDCDNIICISLGESISTDSGCTDVVGDK